jgi:Uma2 family endonuclease
MTLHTQRSHAAPATAPAKVDWSYGWREEYVPTPEGKTELIRIPLTEEEALHPKLGYIMPERTEHDFISDDLCDMLRAHVAGQPGMAVYRNLIFVWDQPDLKPFAPDVAVVPNVQEPERSRGEFVVAEESTRPVLVIEVVSPNSRKADRVTKVRDYATAGVQEYVYIDARPRKGEIVWEIAGFRLEDGRYLPILPDEDDAIYCESVGLRIGIEAGKVWLEDAQTGENLLTNLEAQRARREAESRAAAAAEQAAAAAAQAAAEATARRSLEERLAEVEEQLRLLRAERNQ